MKRWTKLFTPLTALVMSLAFFMLTGQKLSAAGKALNVMIDVEVASLDPQIATDGTSFEVIRQLVDGLYGLDADGMYRPNIAKSVEKSPDGLKYTFKLADEAVWSNGTPVTAHDFVFAWRRLVDPKTASEYNFIMETAGVKNAQAITKGELAPTELGVKALDDKTLEVVLDVPVPYFESLMFFPPFFPVNEKFYNEAGGNFGTSAATYLSNGMFVLSEYEPAATSFKLVKNEKYYKKDKVALSGINYQVIKDSQQAVLSYQNGDIDVMTLHGEQAEQFVDDPEFIKVQRGYLWYISPNLKTKGLDNLNIRKAMAQAFDKKAVVEIILKDGSLVADYNVPVRLAIGPDGKDFRETSPTYNSYDVAAAKKNWEAGLKELGVKELKFSMVVEDTESAQNVAQFLQEQLQTNLPGLTITLEVMPKKNRLLRMQNGEYELGLTRWGPDYADPMTYLDMWITDSPYNYGKYSNPAYDAMIVDAKKGKLATDINARWEELKKAEKISADDVVIMPIYQNSDAALVKSNIKGMAYHLMGGRVYKDVVKE
ncbi:MAG: peptide ABC transporter substrate-binding protein [Fusobacteriaceae bacterium]|jgi:oligopeptide transport system substrate-binding protein|nr:peptide ABC transporter substrate-binding protein [Fusobacteriaceae bacterium]